ncbi:putative destroys radicals which are normally produced within the cells and which are toxic to biological systems [Lyophyllum shimeji]|uniref:Superoxide dismutase n=1 Tax=Lyophyllum shimeji TaxID=47721 RepID=A0A9P3PRP8_LYOSH|nr:putative destroys radicals which are normally produced within the cells and which are toxic to biological systems [Lyophyllum shimeji]
MSNTLPDLPYAYDALEPFISREIMELHHKKHHQTYVNALNAAESAYAKAPTPKERIALQSAIKFNGGGHINHSLFWKGLAPAASEKKGTGGILKDGPLKQAITAAFGSFDNMKKELNSATAGIQGSGWGWLGLSPITKSLEITTTSNQDPLLTHIPIIGIDVWEHAYYLQYFNQKGDYLNAIWNVINFDEAEKRFVEASGSSKL